MASCDTVVVAGASALALILIVLAIIQGPPDLGTPRGGHHEDTSRPSTSSSQEPETTASTTTAADWPHDVLVYGFKVVREYDHDPYAYTQGLLWWNETMYESTGLKRKSSVREVKLLEGGGYEIKRKVDVDPNYFAEGLVYWKGDLLQLLWKTGRGLRYSAVPGEGGHLTAKPDDGFETPLGDGWGFTSDGNVLFATTGSTALSHLDPETFELVKQVTVNDEGKDVPMVNEMEAIEGEIWGNVYQKDCIARFSPDTGKVNSWVVLRDLLDRQAANDKARRDGTPDPKVLNGIAWDPATKRLWVTGKQWPTLFEIELVQRTDLSLEDVRSLCIPPRNVFR